MNNIFLKTIRGIFQQLVVREYWLNNFFTFLSISFIFALWMYIKQNTSIDVSVSTIIIYFVFVAIFNYLFTYEFTNQFLARIDNEWEEMLLLPQSILTQNLKKKLWPLIRNALPLALFAAILVLVTTDLSIEKLIITTALLLISHVFYIYFCSTMAILGKLVNWPEYTGFAMRFIGFAWNGSYIPVTYFSGILLNALMVLPFMPTGIFLLTIWGETNLWPFLAISLGQIALWALAYKLLISIYLNYSRK